MESHLSLADMRATPVTLGAANHPREVDSATIEKRLRSYVQCFGHCLNTREISLRHDVTVAVEDTAYSLWTYEEEDATHFAFAVFHGDMKYFSCYSNYDMSAYFGDDGLTIQQFAQWDRLRFRERELILSRYRELASLDASNPSVRFTLALMVWYLNRMLYPGPMEEAVAALAGSQAIAPRDIESWGLLGIVHYRLGNMDAAKKAIRQAITLNDKDPRFFYYAAQIALEGGMIEIGNRSKENRHRERYLAIYRSRSLVIRQCHAKTN